MMLWYCWDSLPRSDANWKACVQGAERSKPQEAHSVWLLLAGGQVLRYPYMPMPPKRTRFERLREDAKTLLDENAAHLVGWRLRLHRFVHFWARVIRSFNRNQCPVKASSLAYATLLALVPMLAVVVGVTSTFLKQEGEDRIDQFIERFVASITPPDLLSTNVTSAATNVSVLVTNVAAPTSPEQVATGSAGVTNVVEISHKAEVTNLVVGPSFLRTEEVLQARRTIAKKLNESIQNTRSGTLGLTGSILLIFAAISMLSQVEVTFNDIWGVARGRGWFTRIILYWGVITLAPLLLVVALGLATGPHLENTRKLLAFSPLLENVMFQVLPIAVLSLLFSVFYMLMPNTRVNWRAALTGGLTAGVLFHLNNVLSVFYVSKIVTMSKMYGGLGLVLLFMAGMYLAWLIVLFGGQVAYAWQNRATYVEERQVETVNQRGREFVAMRIMTCIGRHFHNQLGAPTIISMSKDLAVPTRLVGQLLQTLVAARLVMETAGQEAGYVPARPLETITCDDVLQAMRATHGQELLTREEPTRAEVYGEYSRIREAERQAASTVNMLHLARRTQACMIEGPEPSDAEPPKQKLTQAKK